jgi:hypothetical protein
MYKEAFYGFCVIVVILGVISFPLLWMVLSDIDRQEAAEADRISRMPRREKISFCHFSDGFNITKVYKDEL